MANDNPDASILDEKLARLFAGAVGGALDSLRALRETICLYVESERDRGTPLEEVIERVSGMIERVRFQSASAAAARSEPSKAERDLAREMVNWCIDSYLPARSRKKS